MYDNVAVDFAPWKGYSQQQSPPIFRTRTREAEAAETELGGAVSFLARVGASRRLPFVYKLPNWGGVGMVCRYS